MIIVLLESAHFCPATHSLTGWKWEGVAKSHTCSRMLTDTHAHVEVMSADNFWVAARFPVLLCRNYYKNYKNGCKVRENEIIP